MEKNKGNGNEPGIIQRTLQEVIMPFKDLIKAPRALWGVNISYLLEGLNYFGILGLLAIYFNNYIGLNDIDAGRMVGIQTAGITIAMVILGATVDAIGIKKALIISLSIMLGGRILIAIGPSISQTRGLWSESHIIAMLGILGIIIGYGMYQPAAYTAVRKFTNVKTAAMGFAMLYAVNNLGGFLPGLISPPIRHSFGITGVFWVYAGMSAIAIILVSTIISKKVISKAMQGEPEKEIKLKPEFKEKLLKRATDYFKKLPFFDLRFIFFIFILIPVQTLFAHNWLTLPQYCSRAFTGIVSNNFEFFVNFNPILIFILTPSIAALTSKKHTYSMMIIGTLVMGFSPFLLSFGPNIYTLFAYIIMMTLGEAIWQPRFLQWVAEIAPKNMTGIYMGFGQFPWFLTKWITSLYSGWFLMNYCPENTAPTTMNTGSMWFIYGGIAIISPLCLIIARKWMMKGFKEKVTD